MRPGFVDTTYDRGDESAGRSRQALARIYALPGGFRLLVGHDLGDRARIGAVMVRALAVSLIFFAALGGARRAVRRAPRAAAHRRDERLGARASWPAISTRRLPVSGSGDELDRLRGRPQ